MIEVRGMLHFEAHCNLGIAKGHQPAVTSPDQEFDQALAANHAETEP